MVNGHGGEIVRGEVPRFGVGPRVHAVFEAEERLVVAGVVVCRNGVVDSAVGLEKAEGAPGRVFGHRSTNDIIDELDSGPAQMREDVGRDVVWWFGDDKGIAGRSGNRSWGRQLQ